MPRIKAQESRSQASEGSDDSGLMLAVAKQVQSTLEKKRKDNEVKFLGSAKAELAKSASAEVEEFEDALEDMKKIFDDFVMQHAAAEDEIRVLWEQLLKAHQKFSTFSEKKHASVIKNEKEREKGQVLGMATSKKAVEDCHKLIMSLSDDA
ncbi:hypothetical protein BDY19DRAFT_239358 [Irpex rosettiformis]|uniref:Uncharacterized protein n=1 Tax=Irpex rosettiformis TaxID=378272 RepID=A0ACB8TZU8_9APHY|nr:hypothetical protein BDY19DRAFT_239358 [Irpex rosettiformis]